MRHFWRLLWTLSVRLTGPSRLTVWVERRYYRVCRLALMRAVVSKVAECRVLGIATGDSRPVPGGLHEVEVRLGSEPVARRGSWIGRGER